MDHTAPFTFGGKPPLSQNLGIPPDELKIEPYVAKGQYYDGDVYLICSDGLTDMVSEEEIADTLSGRGILEAQKRLLNAALDNGGKDNITIILCKVRKKRGGLLGLFRKGRIWT